MPTSTSTDLVFTIAAQLPVVVLFIVVIFKLLDRFDKIIERRDLLNQQAQSIRDNQFLAALQDVANKMDSVTKALNEHDSHVDERINKIRKVATK
jgi:hypothetical protein